jgi:hypothetical protein
MDAVDKDDMRNLILRGRPYFDDERQAIIEYCDKDVLALEKLLPAILPKIDLPRALLRGRYMAAVASMEHAGIPINVETHRQLCERWDDIKLDLIARLDAEYGVYDGIHLNYEKFGLWLAANNIWWPRTATGRLATDDDTFKHMAAIFPRVAPLRELRGALAEMNLNSLAVGPDGRNRTLLSPFRSRTSRNQPSNAKYIFGPSVWQRSLIRPEPGHGLCYIDYSAQEFGIAAGLSGDENMLEAYRSGDPYRAFAKMAGALSDDVGADTYKSVRELYKQCALAVMYGMSEHGLALRLGQPPIVARDLLRAHRELFPTFWKWSDRSVDHAIRTRNIHSVFGWVMHLAPDANPRAVMNFPMQTNASEMLRLACCSATEAGIEVCGPIHDAILIHAPLGRLAAAIEATQTAMGEASEIVLGGRLRLRTSTNTIKFPDRYSDPRGAKMWATVMECLDHQGSDMPRRAHGG